MIFMIKASFYFHRSLLALSFLILVFGYQNCKQSDIYTIRVYEKPSLFQLYSLCQDASKDPAHKLLKKTVKIQFPTPPADKDFIVNGAPGKTRCEWGQKR